MHLKMPRSREWGPRREGSAFFFQAEDGIRDPLVTGVQTCALPICAALAEVSFRERATGQSHGRAVINLIARAEQRSEERRVGKECRCRWSGSHEKKSERILKWQERVDRAARWCLVVVRMACANAAG